MYVNNANAKRKAHNIAIDLFTSMNMLLERNKRHINETFEEFQSIMAV